MQSLKPTQWLGITLGGILVLYFFFQNLYRFADTDLLGGVILLEIIIACIWRFSSRYLVLMAIAFTWAGTAVPFSGPWNAGRWVVLGAGAIAGFFLWSDSPLKPARSLHLIAIFCIGTALVSATVSQFVQMAAFKALSLALLFLYCSSGARLAAIGREERFFQGLILTAEIAVYVTAVCYIVFGLGVWGNPNALGAVMAVVMFPILLWGWYTTQTPTVRFHRLIALLLCMYLVRLSMARAGMLTITAVTLTFCFCLHQYKMLLKGIALAMTLIALGGVLAPERLTTQLEDMKDALLYKGHKEEGVLGSRKSPWDTTVATIKEHPWFGTGYGTSPTVDDPTYIGTFHSSGETAREHGSSYMTILEWTGLLGVAPFAALLLLLLSTIWKVFYSMRRAASANHYSIPLAMVVMAGLIHASFEDWLFAAGSYLCLFFWVMAFLLVDMVPRPAEATVSTVRRPAVSPNPLMAVPDLPHLRNR